MLGKKNMQKDFFNSYVYENLLPSEDILLDIKEQVDFSFVEEELRDLYDASNGRPSYPPEVLFKMLFLEFYYNLSDVEVSKQVRYNILYRYFVGLEVRESTPDDTTLVVFRNRCGKERFERLFDRVIKQCQEKALLKEKLKIIDATSIVADIAIPNTVNLLRQGRRVILKRISRSHPQLAKELSEKYIPREHLDHKPNEDELQEEITKTLNFIDELKGKFDLETKEFIESLKAIAIPSGDKRKLISFVDPDAREGAINAQKMFRGYKAHIAEDESEIVTSIDTLQGHQNEGHQLSGLLKKEQAKGLKSEAVVADAQYSSYENRKEVHKQKMKAYIPKRKGDTKVKRLGFKYLLKEDKLICPQGQCSSSKVKQNSGTIYYFSRKVCRNCSKYQFCRNKDSQRSIRIFISDDYKEHLRDYDDNYSLAQKKRKIIERKIGEAKKWHGLGRARYRHRWRVAIQILMTFLVINIKRMVKLLKEKVKLDSKEACLVLEPG
jgi:IS5 family transposase